MQLCCMGQQYYFCSWAQAQNGLLYLFSLNGVNHMAYLVHVATAIECCSLASSYAIVSYCIDSFTYPYIYIYIYIYIYNNNKLDAEAPTSLMFKWKQDTYFYRSQQIKQISIYTIFKPEDLYQFEKIHQSLSHLPSQRLNGMQLADAQNYTVQPVDSQQENIVYYHPVIIIQAVYS